MDFSVKSQIFSKIETENLHGEGEKCADDLENETKESEGKFEPLESEQTCVEVKQSSSHVKSSNKKFDHLRVKTSSPETGSREGRGHQIPDEVLGAEQVGNNFSNQRAGFPSPQNANEFVANNFAMIQNVLRIYSQPFLRQPVDTGLLSSLMEQSANQQLNRAAFGLSLSERMKVDESANLDSADLVMFRNLQMKVMESNARNILSNQLFNPRSMLNPMGFATGVNNHGIPKPTLMPFLKHFGPLPNPIIPQNQSQIFRPYASYPLVADKASPMFPGKHISAFSDSIKFPNQERFLHGIQGNSAGKVVKAVARGSLTSRAPAKRNIGFAVPESTSRTIGSSNCKTDMKKAFKEDFVEVSCAATQMTESLTASHLRKAKLMFFYQRYPNSSILRQYFVDVKFNRSNNAQLIKWFSNFREYYYIQIEKFVRETLQKLKISQNWAKLCRVGGVPGASSLLDGDPDSSLDALGCLKPPGSLSFKIESLISPAVSSVDVGNALSISVKSELFRNLNTHYNKSSSFEPPEDFVRTVNVTIQHFAVAIMNGKDSESGWKKQIYKVISKLDAPIPDTFKASKQ